jgi:hypothetical protein
MIGTRTGVSSCSSPVRVTVGGEPGGGQRGGSGVAGVADITFLFF